MSVTDPVVPKPRAATVTREADIPRRKRVFVNRNLKMADVSLIGFDMDYTLAIYHQSELEKLSIQLTLKKLVESRGYSSRILDLDYSPDLAVRGLMVDKQLGNVFKMDQYGHVGRCFHGGHLLSREERAALYRVSRVRAGARFAWIDTLFALPEAVMYIRLIEFLEKTNPSRKLDYQHLWDDIRAAIDEAHRDDSLKSVVKADVARFIMADKDLPATLHKLRSAGKRLFLLTNSLYDYTDVVMKFLFDGKLPAYPSWRHYFDIIIVGGAKPAFFAEKLPFVEIDPASGKVLGQPRGDLLRGHVYMGGNLFDFEDRAGGPRGDQILYVGDHIYGDILKAKKSTVWRTAMVVQELDNDLQVSLAHAEEVVELDELDRRRRNLDAEVDYQNLLYKTLIHLEEEGGELPPDVPYATLEEAKKATKEHLDRLRAGLRETIDKLDRLEDKLDRAYNPYWGPIFKEGNELSRFGEQVETYACLYTSRVSNFLAYSPLRYFRAPRDKLPHEL